MQLIAHQYIASRESTCGAPPADIMRALSAVQKDGNALKDLADIFKNDEYVVREAVSQTAKAFRYADHSLRANKPFVLSLIEPLELGETTSDILEYASDALKADKEVVYEAVYRDAWALLDAVPALRVDKDVVEMAINTDCEIMEALDDTILGDKEFMLHLIEYTEGTAFCYASEELRSDKEVVLAALGLAAQETYVILSYAHEALFADVDFVIRATQIDPDAIKWMIEYVQDTNTKTQLKKFRREMRLKIK
jgi:hypothetical protein